ncbi:uroporphyrinogen-III synthase [Sneathiella sp.]|uniref:uroporphyrinogen-III synthase n=1 Tax=Sneathiella sp. TaxID=1964365 RepID=UPI002FE1E16E
MKILITRPEPDATRLAGILSAMGHEPRLAPMMYIEHLPPREIETGGVQALLVTSANGARAIGRTAVDRDLKCFAVGRGTAEALQGEGFKSVTAAGGDVHSLHDVVVRDAAPGAGKLIHISGADVAGDLVGMLSENGFTVERAVLYEALPVTSMDAKITREIRAGKIDAVLLYSPRTAAIFTGIVTAAGLALHMKPMTAYCLSAAIAEKIATLPFREVKIAAEPDQEKLLALLPPLGQAEQKDDNPDTSRERSMSDKKSGKTEEGGTAVPAAGTDKTEKATGASPERAADKTPGVTPGEMLKATPDERPDRSASRTSTERHLKSRSSRGWLIAAALLIVFCLGLAFWPILYPIAAPYLPERAAAIIDGRFARAPAGDTGAASDMSGALSALRDEMKGDYTALAERLTALEEEVKALPARVTPDGGAPAENVAALGETMKGELAALAARLEEQQQTLAAASEQLSAQQESLAKLEAAEIAPPVPSPEVQSEIVDLKTSFLDVKTELGDLQNSLARERDTVAAQASQIATLEAALKSEIDAKANRAEESRRTLMLLAVGQLQRETRGSDPFETSLQQLSAVAEDRFADLIGPLQPIAATGAPTVATLREDFGRIATDVTQTARLPSGETWYGKALHRLASAVKFRRVDDKDSGDIDAVVARAEQKLADNDLAGAVAEVESLEGPAAEIAGPWLDKAKSRLAVENAITGLLHTVTASAAATPAPAPPAAPAAAPAAE